MTKQNLNFSLSLLLILFLGILLVSCNNGSDDSMDTGGDSSDNSGGDTSTVTHLLKITTENGSVNRLFDHLII